MLLGRRQLLGRLAALVAWPVIAHHRAGHAHGPKPSPSPTPDGPATVAVVACTAVASMPAGGYSVTIEF